MEVLNTLVRRAQLGDTDAYNTIVVRFQDMAVGYAYTLLKDFHLSQDAAQEAFICAFQELPNLRSPEAFASWFRRIVFKQCDRLKRSKQYDVISLDDAVLLSHEKDPMAQLEIQEMKTYVLNAIQDLPEAESKVITLFYISEYAHSEIAAFLEMPITTVNNRLRAARKHLKKGLLNMAKDTLHNEAPSRNNKFAKKILQIIKPAEGKTKVIYENPEEPNTVFMYFKDDITAGDGAKHDVIEGKALLDWKVNRDIFEYLNRAGIRTHYIESPEERVSLVKKLDRKIDLEVVTRRIAAGSIIEWANVAEGTKFDPVITQFHYKDDPLHDPMLDATYVQYIIEAKGGTEFIRMEEINTEVILCLEKAFAQFDIQLIDLKLEYGFIGDEVYLIDEISGGSFRLWPYRHKNPDLNQPNVLAELDAEGRLDKDIYRRGESFDNLLSKFQAIAQITDQFKLLKL